jgi:hypothetical protein
MRMVHKPRFAGPMETGALLHAASLKLVPGGRRYAPLIDRNQSSVRLAKKGQHQRGDEPLRGPHP